MKSPPREVERKLVPLRIRIPSASSGHVSFEINAEYKGLSPSYWLFMNGRDHEAMLKMVALVFGGQRLRIDLRVLVIAASRVYLSSCREEL